MKLLLLTISVLLSLNCGGGESSSSLTSISGFIDNSDTTLTIVDLKASPTGIAGVEVILSTINQGANDDGITTGEQQLTIKVIDVSAINLNDSTTLGSGNLFLSYDETQDHFIATLATLVFTKLGRESGDEIEFTLDSDFVSTDFIDTRNASFTGSISATVE